MNPARLVRVACVFMFLVGLAGCSDDGAGVASLTTLASGAQAGTGSDSERATQYVDCLVEKGLPATLIRLDDGSLRPYWDETKVAVVSTRALNGEQVTSYLDDRSPDGASPVADVFPRADTTWGLVIDGIDYSVEYTECRDLSGYIEDWEQPVDPRDELAAKAQMAEAANDWARCARDNGWPQVGDASAPVADGYQTSPTVFLPASMTADQLAALLEACPAFDPDAEWNPTIDFYDSTGTGEGLDLEHMDALRSVLYAESNPYYYEY
ncbi:MAG: hypothetical protein LBR19_02675 [Bifidobacteriaceae bacterium]|jgi:hypothetical protein|nr:hypothetical protein [Bifidobacteriaceae bacterium]